jgi:uncharacterized iron-regulated protein
MLGLCGPLRAGEISDASPDFAALFAAADVVFLGEVHDNPHHHENQARIVAELDPVALVFEMIAPDAARLVTSAMRTDAAELEAHLGWEEQGWPDFAMYYPIFAAAPGAAIVGGGVPRDEARRAIDEGAAAVFGADAGLFGLDRTLDGPDLDIRTALQQEAHCNALPKDLLPGFVEAQRLRDAALARAVVAARAGGGGDGPVIVITGNGHARMDLGAPAVLDVYAGAMKQRLALVALGQFETEAPDQPPFTHWLVTEATDRPDPCEAFR